MAYALQEHGEVDAGPVEGDRGAELAAGLGVAYDLAVAGVVHGIGARPYHVVAVQVNVLEVTGTEALLAASGAVNNGTDGRLVHRVIRSLSVGSEEAVRCITPDLSVLHPFVVSGKVPGRIVELGDIADEIVESAGHAVLEGKSEQHETVPVGKGKLIALGAEVRIVGLGRGSTIDGREGLARGEHVPGIPDVGLAGEGDAVLKERHVQTDVLLLDRLPGKVGGYGVAVCGDS